MDHYVALATLPSQSLAYIPVAGEDRATASAALGPGAIVHALFTDAQLRAIQALLERMDDRDVRRRFAVVAVPDSGDAVVLPVWAHSPAEAQAAGDVQVIDSKGHGPRLNVGAFEMGDIQAMRDCLISGRVHYQEPTDESD